MGITPKYWGRGAWRFLESVAWCYPEKPTSKDKANYKRFFTSLKMVLPCPYCRMSYSQYIKLYPIDPHLKNNITLLKYIYTLHLFVNKERKIQGCRVDPNVPTFKSVLTKYHKKTSSKRKKFKTAVDTKDLDHSKIVHAVLSKMKNKQ
jgi:hypothetical protein